MKKSMMMGLVFTLSLANLVLAMEGQSIKIMTAVNVNDYLDNKVTGERNKEGYLALEYVIYIKNVSQSVLRIPIQGFHRMAFGDVVSMRQQLNWDLKTDLDDQILIQPECDFGFVELRPGEQTMLSWEGTAFHRSRLETIVVQLHVSKEFGERYRSWWGDVSAIAKVVMMGDEPDEPEASDRQGLPEP